MIEERLAQVASWQGEAAETWSANNDMCTRTIEEAFESIATRIDDSFIDVSQVVSVVECIH